MRAAGVALTLFAALLFVPAIVQRIRRAEVFAEQARLDVLALMSQLTLVRGQRDKYKDLYHEAVQRNALLLGHVPPGALVDDTPLHDRLVCEELERANWGDDS